MPHAKTLSASLLILMAGCSGTEPPDPATTADIKADGADGPVTVSTNVPVHLTWNSENATSCQVSPGEWGGTTGSAAVEDLAGATTYRLTCTGPGGQAEDSVQIVVTPPGTEIVFLWVKDSVSSGIYVTNGDGSGLTMLAGGSSPSWSGDGRRIYFLSSGCLYSMNADGTDVRLVVEGISPVYAVSPDGRRIAIGEQGFSRYSDLFVMNADGSERTLIVDLPCYETYTHCEHAEALAWSPDGQRIAYATCSPGHGSESCNIGVVNADGTGQGLLTTSGGRNTEPAWAPDGQQIVFSSGGDSTIEFNPMDLEIINADGSGRRVVLDGDVDGMVNTSPSWSGDGQSIVFVRYAPVVWTPLPERSDLFAVNLDGTGLRQVTGLPGHVYGPDWNPAGR